MFWSRVNVSLPRLIKLNKRMFSTTKKTLHFVFSKLRNIKHGGHDVMEVINIAEVSWGSRSCEGEAPDVMEKF